MTIHFRFLGIWFSTACGNCFAPALQLNHYGLIIRTSRWRETNISRRADGTFWWNSDHIACWFGKYCAGDEQRGYPDIYEYNGILGCHQYIA